MKKFIPNILTCSRIFLTPVILTLGLTNHIWTLIILAIIVALTDFFDGRLARKYNVVSSLGAKLDAIADKVLAIGLLFLLIYRNPAFFYALILEVIIGSLNLYFYLRKKIAISLLVGKIKTWFIFITIILGFVNVLFPSLNFKINWLVYITCAVQIVTLLSYIIYNVKVKRENIDTFSQYVEFYEIIEPFLTNKEFLKRKTFSHHINESVYAHTLRVSFDCYKIGKKLKLDYKSLAIAALLHDFYETPWQTAKEKKPFFQKHAFTHAHNAVLNAKKVFGKKITPKISNIMETHMFPVNKKIPRSREAWILTLVDKADSMDFIMHPIMLYHIFRKDEIDQQQKLTTKKILNRIKRIKKNKLK